MKIRLSIPEDASGLKILNDIFNGKDCNSLSGISESLKKNKLETVVVAEQDGKLVGFCCGHLFCSFCYDCYYGEITELFVLEDFRRQGVARLLMMFLEKELTKKGAVNFQLFTGKTNDAAKLFYRSIGYKESKEQLFRKRNDNK